MQRLNDGTTEPYGFGWELGDTGGSPYVAHSGVWEGYVSYILRYQEDKWSVFVLSNRSDTDTESLAFEIAGLYE